jgi:hypothetical protein
MSAQYRGYHRASLYSRADPLRIARFILFIALACMLSNQTASAQSILANVGRYYSYDAADPWWYDSPDDFELDHNPSFGLEVYFSDISGLNSTSRFGLLFFYQSAKALPVDPDNVNLAYVNGFRYRIAGLMLGYQRRVFARRDYFILLGLSSGLFFITEENLNPGPDVCGELFCGLEGNPIGLIARPEIVNVYYIHSNSYLQLTVSLPFLFVDKEDSYPYSSGYQIQLGIAYALVSSR